MKQLKHDDFSSMMTVLSKWMRRCKDRLRFFEVNEEMSKIWTFRKLIEIIKTDQKEGKDVKERGMTKKTLNQLIMDNGLS
jgi:hypothetical protein